MTRTTLRVLVLLLLALIPVTVFAATDGVDATTGGSTAPEISPHLSVDERAHLVDLLTSSRDELEALAAQAQGDLWSQKPAEDKWSAGEVVEHLALAEEMFLGMLGDMLGGEADPDWKTIAAGGTEALETNLQDRSQKFQAPEMLQPKAEASRQELLERFAKARTMMLDLVRSTDAPVKEFTYAGPPGKLNAQQWLALAGSHTLRHNQQIREALDMVSATD